jgi:tetratricopeptide (TPR) repeat protein
VLIILFFITTTMFAQNGVDIQALIKQGIDLHNAGKYAEAIEKYNEVLKVDPANGYANYEIAFSLYASKKGNEAVSYLEKAVQSSNISLHAAAYSLMGSIYDENHQTQKAVDAYNAAIKINPDYPQLFFNEGIAYFRNRQFAEAENCAIDAIRHDPKNASSQRLYALVTFHQNKRMNALLGFCSFILLEPNTARSAEAYNNIQSILKGGVLKEADGHTALNVSTGNDKETGTFNTGISMIGVSAQSKKLDGIDLLTYEFKSAFTLAGQLAEKKTDKTFFDKFFAEYFYKLAQSDNMPAFAHTAALTINKDESAKWNNEHAQELSALNQWVRDTERGF